MFSPITERSWKVRLLYCSLYAILILGGITMILPFAIMVTGSIEPLTNTNNEFLPRYLVNRTEMWRRYVSAKYQGSPDLVRTAWTQADLDFEHLSPPSPAADNIQLWEEFLREKQPGPSHFMLGFLRGNSRMPSYSGRKFRVWLMERFGTLPALNQALGTQFTRETSIYPPSLGIIGAARPKTRLLEVFEEFCSLQEPGLLIPWNAGGYYRAVYLPTVYGQDIAAFNSKHGTGFSSYAEVPFGTLAPHIARDDWFAYVSQVLCPDFVELTETGGASLKALQISRDEFIRTRARPEDLRVESLDTQFADWASERGVTNARIPQAALDWRYFTKTENFWKWQFLILNYQRVVDEVLLHGRALTNTLILVILSVAGALLVNPLAAYALSRFKLRRTYHILLFFLATMAFPAEVTMIPVFLQLKEFNLLNTFGALVLPSLASGFSIFLLKGFFDSLPKELYEAAELDGASEWTMFWQIGMNLSKPILAVIALSAFTAAYGAFFYALILAPDPKMWTIMVYIYQLRASVDPPVVYASLILTAIPTLLVFVFCQNIILRGIVVPSDK